MKLVNRLTPLLLVLPLCMVTVAVAETQEQRSYDEYLSKPELPAGMSLDDVLSRSEQSPPDNFPKVVNDNKDYLFTMFEQLEYRVADTDSDDSVGWEAQGWYGPDFTRFAWKSEGESVFDGSEEGESETDLLYSRWVSPFWSFQVGAQYANEWSTDSYNDRWSGVIALQGLAPYKFELDTSLYVSESADVTLSSEAEYNLRITQRLVIQPRVEAGFAAQSISQRNLGAGMTDANIDMRLRYEIKRGFAPYVGVRYKFLAGQTRNIASRLNAPEQQWLLLSGIRLAF